MAKSLPKNSIIEEKAFLQNIGKYGGIITRICYYYSDSPEDFRDLRQDVLATLWESRGNFTGTASSSTWIYRVSLNVCVSFFRKTKRRKETIRRIENIPEILDDNTSIIAQYTSMQRMIQRLPDQDKAIILLWLDDLKYEEIADIIGIPRNTIATRLRRIKERLSRMSHDL